MQIIFLLPVVLLTAFSANVASLELNGTKTTVGKLPVVSGTTSTLPSSQLMLEKISIHQEDNRKTRMTNAINSNKQQDSKIMRIIENRIPEIFNNERGGGGGVVKLHIANDAYPVYYGIARANGRFGKYIRAIGINELNKAKN